MQKLLTVMFCVGSACLVTACGGTDSTTTSAAASTGTGMEGSVNGCTEAMAEDHTNDMGGTTVQFGVGGALKYTPACVLITKGHQVIFKGDFTTHPLHGGEVTSGVPTPDPSTIADDTAGMADDPVNFPASGSFGYYCGIHVSVGMMGAIFVK